MILFPDQSRQDFTLLDYPLTDQARRAVEAFDLVVASRRLANDCTPKGMPWAMEQPYDLAFERDGDDVVLRLEEFRARCSTGTTAESRCSATPGDGTSGVVVDLEQIAGRAVERLAERDERREANCARFAGFQY